MERTNDTQLPIRVPSDLVERIDEEVKRLRAREPGMLVSRSAAIRSLLIRALDQAEREPRA